MAVHVVTLLFRVSTMLIVPLLVVFVVVSILLFSSCISTFFAGHGLTLTGMMIGSNPGICIIIVSSPALKLGYNAMSSFPSWTIKSFPFLKLKMFSFFCVVPGRSMPLLLVILATVSMVLPWGSCTLIWILGIASGCICAMPPLSVN